jgi:RNA polymerase sigma-70 factor (ECF subfamily)
VRRRRAGLLGLSQTRRRRQRFEADLRPHLGALWGFACTLAPASEAPDLVQATSLRAFERYDAYRPGSDFRAWLFTILRNEFLSRWRHERRREAVEHSEGGAVLALSDRCPDLEAILIEQRWSEEVRAALRGLLEVYRVPVYLKDVMGLSYREIAEVMGCPLGTVMSRLARGRALLRGALARQARERGLLSARREDGAVPRREERVLR